MKTELYKNSIPELNHEESFTTGQKDKSFYNVRWIPVKSLWIIILFMILSCNETSVTNIVHPDGSVTRRIQIKSSDEKDLGDIKTLKVPFDSTWTRKDSFEIGEQGDTTWVLTAEKLFENVGEINDLYENDPGTNSMAEREARFSKKFRWFNTIYIFSEEFGNYYDTGYAIAEFLSDEELRYYYLPDAVVNTMKDGIDSLKVREIMDSIDVKTELWFLMNAIRNWKIDFIRLAEKNSHWEGMKSRFAEEDSLLYSFVEESFRDSSGGNNDEILSGIMKKIYGEDFYETFRTEADSSFRLVEEKISVIYDFQEYEVRSVMPGKIIATNGYICENGEVLWDARIDYFLTHPHSMWVESKIRNSWAWVISGIFVMFVCGGLMFRFIRHHS